jgi:hypothetical protein
MCNYRNPAAKPDKVSRSWLEEGGRKFVEGQGWHHPEQPFVPIGITTGDALTIEDVIRKRRKK